MAYEGASALLNRYRWNWLDRPSTASPNEYRSFRLSVLVSLILAQIATSATYASAIKMGQARQAPASSASAQVRVLGPEPGVQFGYWPGTGATAQVCTFGEYTRGPNSSWNNLCPSELGLLQIDDIFLTSAVPSNRIPSPSYRGVTPWLTKVTHNGVSSFASPGGNCLTQPFGSSNPADIIEDISVDTMAAQSYLTNKWIKADLLHRKTSPHHGANINAAHPTYLSIDAYYTNWTSRRAIQPGTLNCNGPVAWDNVNNNTEVKWNNGIQAFFDYAARNHPEFRLGIHMGAWDDYVTNNFQSIYRSMPFIVKEPFESWGTTAEGNELTNPQKKIFYYGQIINTYWFANIAAPVFNTASGQTPIEPPSRVVLWGDHVANSASSATAANFHTALALYLLIRGPNTIFDLLYSSPQNAPDLTTNKWYATLQAISTSPTQPCLNASDPRKGMKTNGLNLYIRTYPKGQVWLNMTGSTQTMPYPPTATDWNGNPLTGNFTLADGQGEVVLLTPVSASFTNILSSQSTAKRSTQRGWTGAGVDLKSAPPSRP